jgi:hypothetical protein
MRGLIILATARRHRLSDDQITHAVRNPISVHSEDDLTIYVGAADSTGLLVEVGLVDSDVGPVVVHAMEARERYRPRRSRDQRQTDQGR